MDTKQLRESIRHMYAWPGGYPMYLVTADCDCLCMECAKKEYGQIARANKYPGTNEQWEPVGVEVNWEDTDLYCADCNEQIESAYGEDTK